MEDKIGIKTLQAFHYWKCLSLLLFWVLAGCGCGTATLKPEGSASNHNNRSVPATPQVSIAQPGRSIVVRRGDTLYSLARTHNITPRDLSAWNGLVDPNTIYPGQSLRLYPPSGTTVYTPPPANRNTTAAATPPPPSSSTASTPPAASGTPATATVSPSSGLAWQWPTEGQIVTRFVANDPTKEGIDIGGHNGQAVRAAAAGAVIYSGAPPTLHFGELIIIKHNDHWLSVYGHNRRRMVSEGQRVSAGEQIAEMGRSGTTRDMLHFEIRHDGKPVDPLSHLPAR